MAARNIAVGIDFGTSSSTYALRYSDEDDPFFVSEVIPSQIFFPADGSPPVHGASSVDTISGRFVTSFKSLLSQSDFEAQIYGNHYTAVSLVGGFLEFLWKSIQSQVNQSREPGEINQITLCHPVRFVGDIAEDRSDSLAKLANAASLAGMPSPTLVSEPIAAARAAEGDLAQTAQHAIVLDLGAGTSDLALLIRSAEQTLLVGDSSGFPVAGDYIDGLAIRNQVTRQLGEGSIVTCGGSSLDVPPHPYVRLCDKERCMFMKTDGTFRTLADLASTPNAPVALQGFARIVQNDAQLELYAAVEKMKIELADEDYHIAFHSIHGCPIETEATRTEFSLLAHPYTDQLRQNLDLLISQNGFSRDSIGSLVLCGGTSLCFAVEESLRCLFPEATLVRGKEFSRVAIGAAMLKP